MKLLILLFLPLFSFSMETLTRTQVIMGTFAHITLAKQHNKQISDTFEQLLTLEASLSSYEPHLVYTLNQLHFIAYDYTLADAIKLSKKYYKDTHGYFDITIGSISKNLYHFEEQNSTLPSTEALQHAKRNINAITINDNNITSQKGITLDLGGIGKGYAVDKVVDTLIEQNITQGIISLSGDIRCLDLCKFALQSPYSEQTFATLTAKIPQLSISTSGTYRRFVGTEENHHLIDPKTTKQGRAFVSVSLFMQANNAKIDAYATAISVMSKIQALDFLKSHPKIGFVLVENNANIMYGNLGNFVTLQWIPYKEKTNIASNTIKQSINKNIVKSFTHPDTINPKEISK